MLKKILSALTGAILFVTMPVAGLAAERYEILQVGDEDAWVMELQEKLNEKGYLKVPATGYYGTNTQNAVINYQKDNGLTADGKAGPATRKHILGDDYREITGPRTPDKDSTAVSSENPSNVAETSKPPASTAPEATKKPQATKAPEATQKPAATASPTAKPQKTQEPEEDGAKPAVQTASGDVLQLGDKGEAVSDLQQKLLDYEYYTHGEVTGYFGSATRDAVIRFQRSYSLEQDGVVAREEQAILNSDILTYYTLREGDKGDDVRDLQTRLKELGYLDGTVTGYYGDVTKTAVTAFQERNGLTTDGTAGKQTRRVLYGINAKPAAEASLAASASASAAPSGSAKPSGSASAKPSGSASSSTSGGKLDKFLEIAESRVGKPYVYGAVGPNSFDCSGFVYYALKGAGVGVSRLSSAGYASFSSWTTITSKSNLKIGDLVFFRSDSSSSISHVGIYLGGGNFIHAAPSLEGVGYSTMSSGYYSRNFVSGKRVF